VREAKPGRDKRVAAVGDALTTVVQDAVSVLEAALAATGRSGGGNGRTDAAGPGTRGYPAAGAAAEDASGPGGQAAAPSPGGQETPAPGGQAAEPSPGGQAAANPDGSPAPGANGPAAPEPPEESPHEPDDRG
jgi:hypothetical protein